jgi:hypothetical protein
LSFPRRRESIFGIIFWISAYAGMTFFKTFDLPSFCIVLPAETGAILYNPALYLYQFACFQGQEFFFA